MDSYGFHPHLATRPRPMTHGSETRQEKGLKYDFYARGDAQCRPHMSGQMLGSRLSARLGRH
jgi:hypothetical protein